MSDDIVGRLRHHSPVSYSLLMREAADRIASDAILIERLRAALKMLIDFHDEGEFPTAEALAKAEALLP